MTDPPASLMRVLDLNECLFNYRKSSRYVPVPKDAAYRLPTSLQRLLGAARSRPQAIAKLSSKLKSADSICNAVEYISKDGTRELRNQDNVVNGLTEGRAIARAWTGDKLKRKDALRAVHLIFSSLPGSPQQQTPRHVQFSPAMTLPTVTKTRACPAAHRPVPMGTDQ